MNSPVCEMCGAEQPRLKSVSVEGTLLMLCDRCARFGTEVRKPAVRKVSRPTRARTAVYPEESEYDLALDYPERIRKARESRGWRREELARRINEKLSIIEKLEKGKIRPDDALVSRLEKALQIKLRERVEQGTPTRRTKTRPLTLGDLIRRED
jgi:putative transcription factor